MRRGRLYVTGVFGLLVVAGVVAWRTWSHISAGPSDPVAAVIGIAALAVSVGAFGQAARAQRQSDTDVVSVAARLAVVIGQEETEARRQLLGAHDRTIDVQFAFKAAPAHEAAGASSAGTLQKVVTYYRKLQPRRLVITGPAGSGKSVLAIELILGLLKDRPEDVPVPIRMSAAGLDTSRPPESAVEDWIVKYLRQTYRVSDVAARQLAAARMILPVLDGLDEMDATDEPGYASRAGQVIRACNAYLGGRQKAAIVLTCRVGQYEALQQANEWIHDAARIQLRPVSVPAARSFLATRVIDVGRWHPVLDRMRQHGTSPLAQALSTPWRLTLAATVYDQRDPATGTYLRDPADLTNPAMDTEDRIRSHLLSLYIPAAIAAYGGRYPVSHVRQWLGVLAEYLDSNTVSAKHAPRVIGGRPLSGNDLILHELWPLAGARLPRAITAGLTAVPFFALITAEHTHAGRAQSLLWQTLWVSGMAIFAIAQIWFTSTAWPAPSLLDLQKIRNASGRRMVAVGLVTGLATGLAAGLVLVLAGGLRLRLGLWLGLGLGLGGGLGLGFDVSEKEYSIAGPGEVIRLDLGLGLVFGLTTGLTIGFVFGFVFGLAAGLVAGLGIGVVSCRYVVLLLCTRRYTAYWLPWRLGAFLHWCSQAGLIRVAGIGYQFRHRELQDYLAHEPEVPSA